MVAFMKGRAALQPDYYFEYKEKEMKDWISVEEKCPEYKKEVLLHGVRNNKAYITTGFRKYTDEDGEHYIFNLSDDLDITHWKEFEFPLGVKDLA